MPDYYPLYWIHSNNFGDALNPFLYKLITGRESIASVDDSQKIIACGSVAHTANPGDLIWGTGCNPDVPLKCDLSTQVLALRGPLSAEMFYEHGFDDITEIFGDPALLLPRYFNPSPSKSHKFGIIPHYIDQEKIHGAIINIMNPSISDTINQITACEYIMSSALHGIVCAEAFGIPAVWVEFSDNVAGHGFKFRDYYLGTNRIPPEPLDFRGGIDIGRALDAAKNWQPPGFYEDDLLNVCPFNWTKTDYNRWYPRDSYDKWPERTREVASYIPKDSRHVIEFGAGGGALRNYLPEDCRYTPSDIYKRDTDYIVCDLNSDFLPDLKRFDTVVMIGVVEYINSVKRLFEYIKFYKNINTIIFTYDDTPVGRAYNRWKNAMSDIDFLKLVHDEFDTKVRTFKFQEQEIYICTRKQT